MLSDEALLEIARDDLVDVAKACYDAELASRNLAPPISARAAVQEQHDVFHGELPEDLERSNGTVVVGRFHNAEELETALEVLMNADIPCSVDQNDPSAGSTRMSNHQYFLTVP